MTRTAILLTSLLLFSQNVSAKALQCTIIYSLNGLSHQAFNQQIQTLSSHLKRAEIGLIDMNQWQHQPPHIKTSGRQKAVMRKQYVMGKFANTAVLLDRDGTVISRYENTVELVEMLMNCKRHNASMLNTNKDK